MKVESKKHMCFFFFVFDLSFLSSFFYDIFSSSTWAEFRSGYDGFEVDVLYCDVVSNCVYPVVLRYSTKTEFNLVVSIAIRFPLTVQHVCVGRKSSI